MAVRQWKEEEWKNLEVQIEEANTDQFIQTLVSFTRGQIEHPEWYESPCVCNLCLSYGD